ncbi:hypothetical protein DFJ63DRAFT_33125 [Scheffersomyces coipomensis]|uniref:uncharacterized protein n=1 Tax=Scheffersomyces coipomensis TaxID=1788519 RepID=UPI00315CCCDB
MSIPPTPIHPGPNEEVHELPPGRLPDSLLADIDLDDDEDDDDDKDDIVVTDPPIQALSKLTNRLSDSLMNIDSVDSEVSLEEIDLKEMIQITLPFDEAYELLQTSLKEVEPIFLTEQQQSKLINYIDENLLKIQRKFIKHISDTSEVYTLQELLDELLTIVNLIFTPIEKKNPLFGQGEYYIKILGDVEDYLNHYHTLFDEHIDSIIQRFDNNRLIQFFIFFQKLDLQISLLMDGYTDINSRNQKMNSTQLVRLIPIISRLRILIIYKVDQVRLKLTNLYENQSTSTSTKQESKRLLHLLELEIGRLFEGILERSS